MINIEQLFQMFNHPGLGHSQTKNTRIIIPHNDIATEEEFDSFSNEARKIYEHIFVLETDTEENKKQPIKLQTVLMFQPIQTPMPICNKILNAHEPVFRCYDCMTHQASVLCKKCFENANHKGHRYSQISSGGGNCDCGNPDAINPVGFCVDHPGKAEPIHIPPDEQKNFMEITGLVFQWIFRLHEKGKSKSADILGQALADFLLKRNEKSLYYNTLTYRLIFSQRVFGFNELKREQKYIDKIFEYGVKLVNFAKKMTDVFLNMFSLEVVKYELTVSYTEAYNKVRGFETSKFKSLYIQLFANNDILERMLNQKKIVLYPTKETYDFSQYIENLIFLSSIKEQVAQKFFVLLIQKGNIKFPELDKIEQTVEEGGQHIVNTINKIMNLENYYYILIETIVGLLKTRPQSLHQLFRHYVDEIMEKKYSYHRNKVIMPFHKVLAIILMAICQGDLQNISVETIEKIIGSKYSIKEVFSRIFRLILSCWKEFSKTFFETSYFDNYIPLYVKSGNTIVVFDLLMFSICIQIFQKVLTQQQINEMICEAFEILLDDKEKSESKNVQNKEQQSQKPQNTIQISNYDSSDIDEQWIDEDNSRIDEEPNNNLENIKQDKIKILKKNVEIMKIMIQSCISERSEIIVANSIKIQNEKLKLRTEKLFVEVMNNFKEISAENLKLVNKNFIETKHFEDQLIQDFLTFDKFKKKYTLNQMKDERFSPTKTPLFLYPSMKKFGGIFAEEIKEPIENVVADITLPKDKIFKLKFLFNDSLISKISKQFLDQLTNSDNKQNKQIIKNFLDFLEVIKTIQYLMRVEAPMTIYELYQKIADLSTKQEFNFLSEKFTRKHSEDLLQKEKLSTKLKFEEKKRKKLEKIKKMQQSYNQHLQEKKEKKEQEESICLICREQNSQGLGFLSSFSYSNILQAFNKAQGSSLVFDSCFHPIHIKCFIKTSQQQSLPCPLCKCLSNIMLPFENQFNDEKIIFDIYERIITLKATFENEYNGYDKDFEQFGILSVFRALACMIGKNLLKNEPILDEKDQRIANILYGIVKTASSNSNKKYQLSTNRHEKEMKALEDFIQIARKKIEQSKYETTNLYAVEYISLKIFNACFTQNSSVCLSVLSQPATVFINRNDLRKIWQMCNQVVSLPVFEWPDQSTAIQQMSSVIDLYIPPETVFELIHLRDSTEMSCKNGHQMCICVICKVKCCYDCKKIKKHFRDVHCGQGLAFNVLTGGFVYVWEDKLIQTPSLYLNQMGFEWKPSKAPQGFDLDKETFEQLKKSILNEKITKFLMQKYPDILKKGILMDINMM